MARNRDLASLSEPRRSTGHRDADDWYRRWISSVADDFASNMEGEEDREARMQILQESLNRLHRRLMPRRSGHSGRGPRGYIRSDERIREEVNERLTADRYVDATEIEVSVEEGIVTLTGKVDNRAEKRLAEDCVDDVSGVRDVNNLLRIREPAERAPRSTREPHGMGGRRTAI
jgi:osmotically-inducible protein OsmY